MSADEDTELRDLVTQSLENKGVLGKIRAQIRANVFFALEEQNAKEKENPLINKELLDFLTTRHGKLTANLVREFLEYFNLEFTQAVFDPETSLNIAYDYPGRSHLCEELEIKADKNEVGPILNELVRKSILKAGGDTNTVSKELTSDQIAYAEMKFDLLDKGKKGVLSKEEIIDLCMDIFPKFRRNMLERFINDEFHALNKSFGQGINFDEFLAMYQQFFSICRGVVTHDPSLFTLSNKSYIVSNVDQPSRFSKDGDSLILDYKEGGNEDLKFLAQLDQDGPLTYMGSSNVNQDSPKSADDPSEDSFFDDHIPEESKKPLFIDKDLKSELPDGGDSRFFDDTFKLSEAKMSSDKIIDFDDYPTITTTRGSQSLGSLRDAPPLVPNKGGVTSPIWQDLDQRIAGLGLSNPPDDDYEEDFQSSLSIRSDLKSGTENSVEEEIEADMSAAVDDFLNSPISGGDEMTIDKTVSQVSDLGADYMESIG